MTTNNNKLLLEAANLAVTNGDNEGFLKYCTEDVKWIFVGDKILTGKKEVLKYMNETYLEPPKFKVKNLIAENNFVTAIGDICLKYKDGKATNYKYCDVWKFREGKMAELKAFVIEC